MTLRSISHLVQNATVSFTPGAQRVSSNEITSAAIVLQSMSFQSVSEWISRCIHQWKAPVSSLPRWRWLFLHDS